MKQNDIICHPGHFGELPQLNCLLGKLTIQAEIDRKLLIPCYKIHPGRFLLVTVLPLTVNSFFTFQKTYYFTF